MSTKTLRKRIALVAVSAMGFGLLTAAPSSAAVSTSPSTASFTAASLATPYRVGGYAANVNLSVTSSNADGTTLEVDLLEGTGGELLKYLPVTASGAGVATFTASTALDATAEITATLGAAGATTTLLAGTISANVAGAYSGIVWWDTSGNGAIDSGEPSVLVSFTTAGAPTSATLTASASNLQIAASAQTYTLSAFDAAGRATQLLANEFFTISADPVTGTAALGGEITAAAGAAGAAVSDATVITSAAAAGTFGNGTATVTVTLGSFTDSAALTATPSALLSAYGLTTLTATVSTNTYTAVAATSSVTLSAPTTNITVGALAAGIRTYTSLTSNTSYTVSVSGLDAAEIVGLDVDPSAAMTAAVNGGTAGAAGVEVTGYSVVNASGVATFTIVTTGNTNAGDLDIDLQTSAGADDTTGTVDGIVINLDDAAYAFTMTAPSQTTWVGVNGGTTPLTGTIATQFGSALANASVTISDDATSVLGTQTYADQTTTTGIDGSFSINVALPAATATSLVLDMAVATGAGAVTVSGTANFVTINLTTTGQVSAITAATVDSAGTAVGNQTTTVPHVQVPGDGTYAALGVAPVAYTLAGNATTAATELVGIDINSTPISVVTVTGSAGVRFVADGTAAGSHSSTALTTIQVLSDATATVETAANVWAYGVTTGLHTVTMTSGSQSTTVSFYASAQSGTGRNISVTGPVSLANGQVGTYTATVTDNFGNVISGAVLNGSVAGLGYINGSLSSANDFGTTNAAGQASLTVVAANNGAGTVNLTITGDAAQFGNAVDVPVAGFTASISSATAAIAVTSSTTATLDSIAATLAAMIAQATADAAAAATAATAATTAAATNEAARAAAATAAATAATAAATAATAQDAAIAAAKAEAAAAATAAATAATAQDAKIAALQTALDAANAALAAMKTQAATDAAAAAKAATDAAAAAAANAATAATAAEAIGEQVAEAIDAARDADTSALAAVEAADAATAAAQQAGEDAVAAAEAAGLAAVEAATAAADAASEAIDAGNNAYDSANGAAEAADSATAAAVQAGEDAVAAAVEAGAAAVEAAALAADAAAEATDAATAATDAANSAAEAADSATAAAQDAADAVAALSVQVTEMVDSLKKQITSLTNLVIRIQKKVKA